MVHCDKITQSLCDYLTSASAFNLQNSASNCSLPPRPPSLCSISGNLYAHVPKGIRKMFDISWNICSDIK